MQTHVQENGASGPHSQKAPHRNTFKANFAEKSDSLQLDFAQAERFLKILDPDRDEHLFQSFDDNKDRRNAALAHTRLGPLERFKDEFVRAQNAGAGIFYTVNLTDGSGKRTKDNIARVRAVWQDDDQGFTGSFPLEPHVQVETSPGKYQRLWLVEGVSFNQHAAVMKVMCDHYGCDPNAKDLARVLRLPGTFHLKDFKSPYLVRVVHESGAQPYTAQEVLDAFGVTADPDPAQTKPQGESPSSTTPNIARARKLAFEAAMRTVDDPQRGRHAEIVLLGNVLRRERILLTEDIIQTVLETFAGNMRPTDTAGKVCGLNWDAERKALADGYNTPTEPDRERPSAHRQHEDADTADENDLAEVDDATKIKAVVMARMSAIKGYSPESAIQHLVKKFPDLSRHAGKIVAQAFKWFEQYKPGNTAEISGQLKRITSIDDLNRRFAILDAEDQPAAIILRNESRPVGDKDFLPKVSDEVVVVGIDKDGNPVFRDAGPFWKGDARRHVYRRIDFTNKKASDDTLNLFRGFGVDPKPGTPELALSHITEVICSGNQEMAANLVRLMAWQVQNVGRPSRVIVLLYSQKHQAGKGILTEKLLTRIWGTRSGHKAIMKSDITGDFNRHLLGKSYLMMDEALFSGDRASADLIKGLVVADTMAIQPKFVDKVMMPSALNLWLNSNHEHAAFIEEGDARYSVIEVSDHRVGDYEYFQKIGEAIDHGDEANRFLHYLLNLDLAGFIPQRDAVFETKAKKLMQAESLDPLAPERWLRDCCATGTVIGMHLDPEKPRSGDVDWIDGSLHKGKVLFDAYGEWALRQRSPRAGSKAGTAKFWDVLNAAGIVTSDRRSERGMRALPAPESVLSALKNGK